MCILGFYSILLYSISRILVLEFFYFHSILFYLCSALFVIYIAILWWLIALKTKHWWLPKRYFYLVVEFVLVLSSDALTVEVSNWYLNFTEKTNKLVELLSPCQLSIFFFFFAHHLHYLLFAEVQKERPAGTREWHQQAAGWRRPTGGDQTPCQRCHQGTSVNRVAHQNSYHNELCRNEKIAAENKCRKCLRAVVVTNLGWTVSGQAHRDGLHTQWQVFLNLCIAQETHLDNIEEYKKVAAAFALTDRPTSQSFSTFAASELAEKSLNVLSVCLIQFQLDAETLAESLSRLNSTLDLSSLTKKSTPEALLALEVWLSRGFPVQQAPGTYLA